MHRKQPINIIIKANFIIKAPSRCAPGFLLISKPQLTRLSTTIAKYNLV